MSVKELSTVEQDLAFRLLHGFWGPLNSLPGRLLCVQTTEQQLSIVKELMETHLSKKGHPVVVNLQDERISEIFDEAKM